MSRLMKRNRRLILLGVAMLALLIGGAAILGAKTWLFPDRIAAARAAYSRGDWALAASLAHLRLKESPDDPEALRMTARAAARQDQDQKAIAIYNRLVVGAMDPEDFFLLGRATRRSGQIDSALKAYEMAREGDPDHAESLDGLTQLYLQNDRYDAAVATAERLARQPAWEARAQLMLGTARAEVQDHAGAAVALRRWLQLDPEGRAAVPHPVTAFRKLLARSLLRSRQPVEARQALGPLLESKSDAETWWLLSRCFLQERAWDQAAELLSQAQSFRAEHPAEFEPAPYVGEARCAGCHRPQYESLIASRHATTFSRGRDLGNLPLPKGRLPDPGNPQVTHQFHREGDSLAVETRKGDRVLRAVVDYAFGSLDHYTTFVAAADREGSYMIRMSHYDSPRGSGWDLSTGLPAKPTNDDEYLGKKMIAEDGVRRCLYCHTTNLHAVLTEAGPEAADHSIGCERCHGPGGHHVEAVEAGISDIAIANLGQAPAAAINDLCSKCHSMQRPDTITAPHTDPVWLRFQSLTLTWSRCFTESQTLSCVTCHDPHRNRETSPTRNEAKCLGCHGGPAAHATDSLLTPTPAGQGRLAPSKPTLRGPTTVCPVDPAKGCIDCHMPRKWQQGTHSFKTDHLIRVHEGGLQRQDGR